MAINDGGPAFPVPSVCDGDGSIVESGDMGMSMRDWFAGHAMHALISVHKSDSVSGVSLAHESYKIADFMLAERNKR